MQIYTIGGYNEVGKNMTAVKVGDDVVVFDCGLHLPPIVELEESERINSMNEKKLRALGAVPNDTVLDKAGLREKVRAFLISHAHLDHVGALPYLAGRYNADIVSTPFTIEVLKTLQEESRLPNNFVKVQPNSTYNIKGKSDIKAEFINITHSTIQASLIALHTKEGIVLYANDFKFDDNPILGKKPNYERLKSLAKEGIKALVVESLYAGTERKTPSEKVARSLLEDVMFTIHNKNNLILVTTFSSHIARLKSIVDFGKQLNRKVVFVGRSLSKYVLAAERAKLCPFTKDIKLCTYKKQKESMLKKIDKEKQDYLLVCTGHQGEPGSVLDRIAKNELPLRLTMNDNIIFSSSVIPTPQNLLNRRALEEKLKIRKTRIFDNVHVSGHAAREDLRDFINMLSPEHIIPAHGDNKKLNSLSELAHELGYKSNCHVSSDMQKIDL